MDRGQCEREPAAGEHFPLPSPLTEVWCECRRWLAAILYAYKPREVDLEDLMQDVAMKLIEHGHHMVKPGDPAAIRPWLRTVAINTARSAGRKVRTRNRAGSDLETDAMARQAGATPDGEDARDRGRRALEVARSLPPAYREALLLNLRGLSQRQIAHVLEVPVTTVETRLIRARRMVRDELEGPASPESEPRRDLDEVLS
jgi:RNA polymerase sigma-70 factor (ECF subfamily)